MNLKTIVTRAAAPFELMFVGSFALLLLAAMGAGAQQLKDPDEFLMPRSKDSLPKIFLVGTFHFAYYNADGYKVDKARQIDVLSEQRQKELKELMDYISLFRPNKILIEATSDWHETSVYKEYKAKKLPLAREEMSQIGFRLMDRFGLDTIYQVDAGSIADDLSNCRDSLVVRPYIDSIFSQYSNKNNARWTAYRDYKVSVGLTHSLLDYFRYMNSPKVLRRAYGAYLVDGFKMDRFRGADALATYWYDRNLRIFRNIQHVTTSPHDRILVLFGADHIAVLDQLLDCSPEYDYVKFGELGKPRRQ